MSEARRVEEMVGDIAAVAEKWSKRPGATPGEFLMALAANIGTSIGANPDARQRQHLLVSVTTTILGAMEITHSVATGLGLKGPGRG